MSGRSSRSHNRGRKRDNKNDGRWNNLPDKEFLQSIPLLRPIDKKGKDAHELKATKFDYHAEQNRIDHHTDEYENMGLILRRGQVFNMSVTFDRPMDAEQDKITLQFVTGSRPQQSKNSIIRVPVTESLATSSWGVQIVKQREATLDLSVMSPAHAIVGVYSVFVETKSKKSDGESLTFRKELDEKITLLFNAWCEDDTVYMENDDHRNEYVLNDHGLIWIGSYKRFRGRPWSFGQFEPVSLETCLELIKMAEIKGAAQGNPILICRAISKLVNSIDDCGVLQGNWSGSYKEGISPSAWTGSVAILNSYKCSDRESVKYGQCWVFSGLVTTLLRAIGIPTRSVTNFKSAHDNDGSMTIDYHYDQNDKPMKWMNDSVWNFHVWNESYFTRPDLPSGYDGWQAHDSTPQETSDGVYQCGPCPVKAIQKGEVYLPYDAGFVFAEVNGDKVMWNVDEDGEMTVTAVERNSVGRFISTKAVGSNDREDLTLFYKFAENSDDERNAVTNAHQYSSHVEREIDYTPASNDVSFEIQTSDNAMIGADFDIKLALKNESEESRTLKVTIVAQASFYTGMAAMELRNKTVDKLIIGGGKDETVVLPITFDDYRKMAPDANISVFFNAKVTETGQVFVCEDIVEMIKPDLEAEFPDQVNLHNRFQVTFSLTNPLPVKLTRGKLNVESSGMIPSALSQAIRRDIGPHERVTIPVTMEYYRSRGGKRFIEAAFHSDQLTGVLGEFEINVV